MAAERKRLPTPTVPEGDRMRTSNSEVTAQLQRWADGEAGALDGLLPVVVGELRRIAGSFFKSEKQDHTLQPTALVNEVCLKLYGWRKVSWENRRQFFAFAAQLMRRLLIDHSRGRNAAKRGSQVDRVSLAEAPEVGAIPPLDLDQLIDLGRVLERLRKLDPRAAEIVELRYYTGLSVEECAETLGLSTATVKREWAFARRWLARELDDPALVDDPEPGGPSPSLEEAPSSSPKL